MKRRNSLQKFVTFTVLMPALTAFSAASTSASTTTLENIQPATSQQKPFQKQDGYQLAQDSDNCHQVVARNGVYIRQAPTVSSRIIGYIPYGRYVTVIENPGSDVVMGNPSVLWYPISAPEQGYVFAQFVGPCQSSPGPANCREVAARGGLNVRREPSVNSAVVGVVPRGRNVTIENRGVSGWVPISAPFQGYVSSNYLRYCP
jgi:uncharacterized protein YgiM (DUF1202 family)